MAKLAIKKASTDVTTYVFIQDSSKTTGEGLTGLAYNTASLVGYYVRPKGSATAITLATQTVTGDHSDGGFVEIDATNMPGVYRLDLPDAVCATGVPSVVVMLKGATNMSPVVLEIQLTDFDLNAAGVTLADTQPAITWGQQKIVANVANEGALDIVNTNLAGIGQRNCASNSSQGSTACGMVNSGYINGQVNASGIGSGLENASSGGIGQRNLGAAGGVKNISFNNPAIYNEGSIGTYNKGTDTAGVQNEGTTIGEYNVSADGIGQLNAGDTQNVEGFDPAIATASNLQTVDDNVDSILADTGTDGVVLKAAGLNADAVNEIVAGILAAAVESTLDVKEVLRIMLSALAGKVSGGGTSTIKFRDYEDGFDRISATVDASGNRSAITLNGGDS